MKQEKTKSDKKIKLFDSVVAICKRLSEYGWNELFIQQGLDILSQTFEEELLKPLQIDRTQPGFEDFCSKGFRAIEPSRPAESLLFHAFASPQVISWRNESGIEIKIKEFPTAEEICIIENYVFGVKPPSIKELAVKTGNNPMAIVVFASEYRPSINTVHQKHADKCFSRVGISRVGTAEVNYLSESRGYLPFVDGNDFETRVTPCYFSAYISVMLSGDKDNFGPMRFQTAEEASVNNKKGDEARKFWVPIHKLFEGNECIRGLEIHPKISANHINEKLRKVHKALATLGYDTGFHEPDISKSPFRFEKGIANFSVFLSGASGLVLPVVHSKIVEKASYNGKILTYKVPPDKKPFRSSINIEAKKSGARSAPEYVHARHKFENGKTINLNTFKDVEKIVEKGGYEAIHYIDYTGDGCVVVDCSELSSLLPETIPAYSMVSAVDFFPLVKQYDLINWWQQSVPSEIQNSIWPENPGPPLSLCDSRYPANQSLTLKKLSIQNEPKVVFKLTDDTISTIVGLFNSCGNELTFIDAPKTVRVSTLPDGAAGVFAPGWDTSIDRTEEVDESDDGRVITPGTTFFNNYGLGSPFPEDSMLCAALSSFWPAAAPDITRSFAPNNKYATATPLTDDVIGQGSEPSWNEIPGPRISDKDKKLIEFLKIEYGDFVQTSLDNKFNYSKITKISTEEYTARTISMVRVYICLGALTTKDKAQWVVFSFLKSSANDAERLKAEQATGTKLNDQYSYRFIVFKPLPTDIPHPDFRKKYVKYEEMIILYADSQTVIKSGKNGWELFRY